MCVVCVCGWVTCLPVIVGVCGDCFVCGGVYTHKITFSASASVRVHTCGCIRALVYMHAFLLLSVCVCVCVCVCVGGSSLGVWCVC